jgi:hypothetical protein
LDYWLHAHVVVEARPWSSILVVVLLVGEPAVLPDLQILALCGQVAELDHGGGEVGVPLRRVVLVLLQLAGGEAVRAQHPVGLEEHLVDEVVVVVAVVQDAPGGAHPHGRGVVGGVLLERGARVTGVVGHRRVLPSAQQLRGRGLDERRLVVGVDGRGVGAEAVPVGREVRDADGVRAGEDDELLDAEVPAGRGEVGLQLAEVEGGLREVGVRGRGGGDDAVLAAGRDGVEDLAAAEDVCRVAPREREDVGAGGGGADLLLDGVDDLEAREADVVDGLLLGVGAVGGRLVQEHGSITTL